MRVPQTTVAAVVFAGVAGVTMEPDGAIASNRDGDLWSVHVDGDEADQRPDVGIAGD